jgi:hypothetical protein
MDQALIKTLLESPLPVRLALLDADSTGAGWLVPVGAFEAGNCYVAMRVTPYERGQVRDGAAWLPCNPLAIVEHAARLASGASEESSRRYGLEYDTGDYTAWEGSLGEHGWKNVQDKCPHTAAVALLREVVG